MEKYVGKYGRLFSLLLGRMEQMHPREIGDSRPRNLIHVCKEGIVDGTSVWYFIYVFVNLSKWF